MAKKTKTKTKKRSNLPQKSAGLAASAVISFGVIISVANHQDPFQTLSIAAMFGILAGFIGYWIGVILDKGDPTAVSKKEKAAAAKAKAAARATPELSGTYEPIAPVTGDETFLDDLDTMGSSAPESSKDSI